MKTIEDMRKRLQEINEISRRNKTVSNSIKSTARSSLAGTA
jgi:hypothetical protein